jgi:acyl carrier protein
MMPYSTHAHCYETTAQPTWFETSISLIEGWSRFEDEWRRDIPLLTAERWCEALQANGFVAVESWPRPGMITEVLGAHIILAQAPSDVPTSSQSGAGLDVVMHRSSHTSQPEETMDAETTALLQRLNESAPAERELLLINYVRQSVMRVTRSDPSKPPDRRQRLMDFGVDSLMAVDLRNRLSKGLGFDRALSATLVFDHPTIQAIAEYLNKELFKEAEPTASSTATPSATELGSKADSIADLSEEEVEKLLMKKLGDMN